MRCLVFELMTVITVEKKNSGQTPQLFYFIMPILHYIVCQ